MASDCCKLAGNLDLGITGCIISVSVTSSTEFVTVCGDEPLEGPTVGTLNFSAYGDYEPWRDCTARASVSIPYARKYDCENDRVYFVFQGRGQSFYTGSADRYVSLYRTAASKTRSMNANASSGPSSLYEDSTQVNGYGLSYTGEPIGFETDPEGTKMTLGGLFAGYDLYLQSFNLELNPGSVPIATYSFVFPMQGGK